MDSKKALRIHHAIDESMDVFIISQALAEKQLRLSGVNFFMPDGSIGSTGKNLEKFLNRFKRTVYPPKAIFLDNGSVIPKGKHNFISVYNTETTQCYPGKTNRGTDRPPKQSEIQNCFMQDFLIEEIGIINPKVLILMGDKSRKTFYKYFLNSVRRDNLRDHIFSTTNSEKIPSVRIKGVNRYIFPIQHASGANPNFSKMVKSEKLIDMIKGVLK